MYACIINVRNVEYTVNTVPGKMVEIISGGQKVSFKAGDTAVHDSFWVDSDGLWVGYTHFYHGVITKIGRKTVTVRGHGDVERRMRLEEFCRRNSLSN